jgi:hypothetical protein
MNSIGQANNVLTSHSVLCPAPQSAHPPFSVSMTASPFSVRLSSTEWRCADALERPENIGAPIVG